MRTLAWDLHGFEELLSQCVKFSEVVRQLKGTLSLPRSRHGNIKAEVSTLRNQLLNYVKNLYGKKRTAAMHLFVFMIADECRNLKPYAVPVRVLPFKSVTDKKVRELEELRNAMTSIGMPVVGEMCMDSTCIYSYIFVCISLFSYVRSYFVCVSFCELYILLTNWLHDFPLWVFITTLLF